MNPVLGTTCMEKPMHNRISVSAIALATVVLISPVGAQIFDYGKYPDWSGQWLRVPDGGPPRYDPSKRDGLPQQAPLKAEYQARLVASLKDQEAGGQGDNPTYKCIPVGMPRMMSGVFPHEFVFTPSTTFILFEFMINSPRRIYTDGRDWPKDLKNEDPTYVGYSIGRWVDADGSIQTATATMTSYTPRPATFAIRAPTTSRESPSPTMARRSSRSDSTRTSPTRISCTLR